MKPGGILAMFHFLFLLAIYFLPTLIAGARHVYCRSGIVLLNAFLGWTGIGWIVALIWALTAPTWYDYYYAPPPPPYPPYPPYY
jgi:hypothetical protein